MATTVYIDGFNLYYGALRRTDYRWLDLQAFCRVLLPSDDITQIRYFTARVGPRPGDLQVSARQQAYLRALGTLPIVSVHYGHFLSYPTWMPRAQPVGGGHKRDKVQVLKTEEKGSDVNLASFMLLDGFQRRYDTAVVISNDSDLCEPVRMVRHELHLQVGVINPHPADKRSRVLSQDADFFKQVRVSALRRSQFPVQLQDAKGLFHKPAVW